MATKIKKRKATAHTYASGTTATFPGDSKEEALRRRVGGTWGTKGQAHKDMSFPTSKLLAAIDLQVVRP